MAIMYDHEVEVTMTVYVRSLQENSLDYKNDVTDALREELAHTGVVLDYEIVDTTTGDY
jgi:hypothetical protein